MKKDVFLNELAEVLEVEDMELTEETNLNDLEEYDSLAVMSLVAFIDENFDKKLSAAQFTDVTTVKSLMKLIGLKNFV
jgi:acyl carrier protein